MSPQWNETAALPKPMSRIGGTSSLCGQATPLADQYALNEARPIGVLHYPRGLPSSGGRGAFIPSNSSRAAAGLSLRDHWLLKQQSIGLVSGGHQHLGCTMRTTALLAFILLSLCQLSAKAVDYRAGTLHGLAVYIDDGDTIVLLDDGRTQHKIRLASIDAPETSHTNRERGRVGQPYADKARDHLAGLIKGKQITALCYEPDRYSRLVCDIQVGGMSVNEEMVRSGFAWANTASGGRYLRDKRLAGLQAQARSARKGLWAGSHPVEPWQWRKQCWQSGDCPN